MHVVAVLEIGVQPVCRAQPPRGSGCGTERHVCARGNLVRIQDCPATVWGHRANIARRPESDYLPIVLGAPHPAVCRLEDWASADSAHVRAPHAFVRLRVVATP